MTLPLAADAALLFGDFAESVGFRTSPAGSSRSIQANVNRQPVEDDNAAPAGSRPPRMHVMVRHHATAGVLPSEVVDGVSQVEIAYRLDDSGGVRWRTVVRIVNQNAGCVLLEVQS